MNTLEQAEVSTKQAMLQQLGMIFVRVGLYCHSKGKLGPDGKNYSLQEIQQMYLKELGNAVGHPIKFEEWTTTSIPASETHPAAPSSAKQSAAPSLQDLNTASWRLKDKKGIEVGNFVKRDGTNIPYKVINIDDQ